MEAKEKVKVLAAHLYLTLCDPMDCSPPGCSIHGILQARILEWVAMPSSRGSSQPRWLNLGLLHCRQILYHLSHQGSQRPHSMSVVHHLWTIQNQREEWSSWGPTDRILRNGSHAGQGAEGVTGSLSSHTKSQRDPICGFAPPPLEPGLGNPETSPSKPVSFRAPVGHSPAEPGTATQVYCVPSL